MKMKDVARIIGVSRQTVSAVLNNKDWVSAETRERVQKALQEHNYMPNQHAVTLKGKASRLLGVVLRDIGNPFFTQIALGVEQVARANNYACMYFNTFENHDYEVAAIRTLLAYRVTGIIISPIALGADLSHIQQVTKSNTPLVSLGPIPGIDCYSIVSRDENAAREMTDYVISQGHRNIGFLGGPLTSFSAQERHQGYMAALKDHSIKPVPEQIISAGLTDNERCTAARQLLTGARRPTAVVCFNDIVAVSVYKVAHELQLRIPEDLSVVGFDDIELASLLGPPLTTMRLDPCRSGEMAADLILKQIKGENGVEKEIHNVPTLVERTSVSRLRKASPRVAVAVAAVAGS